MQLTTVRERLVLEDANGARKRTALGVLAWLEVGRIGPSGELTTGGKLQRHQLVGR